MTVPGQTPAVAADDRQAADRLFTQIYADYWDRVRRYIWTRLEWHQDRLAEDIANDVFIDLWLRFILPGRLKNPERPLSLLFEIAKSHANQQRLWLKNNETALDLADPANAPVVATGHAYAAWTPDLASISRALEAAMEHMTEASETWRSLHKQAHRHRRVLSPDYRAGNGGATPESLNRALTAVEDAEQRQASALKTFRAACARVGQLRADLEAAGGPNWKSSAGMPASVASSGSARDGSVSSDLNVTSCPNGHDLVLNNVEFDAAGLRRCRTCRDDLTRQREQAKRAQKPLKRSAGKTLTADTLAAARALFVDPAKADVPMEQLAADVGCHLSTLKRRIPEYRELRAAALEGAAR